EFVGIAFDVVDVGHVYYQVAAELERDLVAGTKAGPFGLTRMPGRNRVHGSAAVSAGIAPGAAQIRSLSAIGSKSARKCTELLLTRIACSVGSMPTKRYIAWSASCALWEATTIRTSSTRRQAD